MASIGLSHLGAIAKKALLSPGSVGASDRSSPWPNVLPSLSVNGTPCAKSHIQPREGQS